MKMLFRWAFRLFILGIVLLIGAILLMDTMFKAVAENRIRAQTGLDVKIGKFSISLLNRKLVIEDLVLYNSAEFGGSTMINLPEVYLECDAEALQQRRLRFKIFRLNLSELNSVNSASGKNNFEELMAEVQKRETKSEKKGKETLEKSLEFGGIDVLNLTLGKLRLTDLKNPAKSQEFDLRIKEQIITDIKNESDLQTKLSAVLVRTGTSILTEMLSGAPPPQSAPTAPPVQRPLTSPRSPLPAVPAQTTVPKTQAR